MILKIYPILAHTTRIIVSFHPVSNITVIARIKILLLENKRRKHFFRNQNIWAGILHTARAQAEPGLGRVTVRLC